MIRNALIAGATGLVGKELTQLLIKSDYYNSLHIVGRRPYILEHSKVKSYIIDFDNFESLKTSALIHDVYICLGTTMKKAGSRENFKKVDFGYVMKVAQWAKNNKVEKLAIISSMGANATSKNFYLRTKGEAENTLIGLELPKLIILQPSLLLGKRGEFRLAERMGALLVQPFLKIMKGKLKKYSPVQATQVAKAMFHLTLNATESIRLIDNINIINLE